MEMSMLPFGASSPTLCSLLRYAADAGGETPPANQQVIEVNRPGSDLGSLPFVLSFNNLTYSVRIRSRVVLPQFLRRRDKLGASAEKKVILSDVSGQAREGEILAVIGASGSGKSTLIDALACKISKESLKGTVTLNGEPLGFRQLKVISAYVMQDDLLYPMLTVEETLMFAAELRLPRTLSNSKKKQRVQALIDQLGLRNAAATVIGDEGHRGVSGGERRRVSIGIDIIHDPIVLFLDEPTSGLDSTSAFNVVKVLQRIAQTGSIVIMSVHQPSCRIMGLLDRLLFLSRGETVYSGSPANLTRFFSDFGHPIPESENRAEFALDLIRELEGSTNGTKGLVEFNRTWTGDRNIEPETSNFLPLKFAIATSVSRGKLVSGATANNGSPVEMVQTYANPIWTEIFVLSKRSFRNMGRMPEILGTRLGTVTITGFILATMFWRLDDSPRGVQERLGFFAFAMSLTFYTCADTIPVFIQERYIFLRETAHNSYRRSSYCLSHALVSLPSLFFFSFVFAASTFWAVGLSGGVTGFFFYHAIILASFWAGNSFVTFVSSVVPHVMLGYIVVVAVLAYFLLFSGFFMNHDRIPRYWIWFHYISLVKYPYEGVLQNEFKNPEKCFVRGMQMFDSTPLGSLSDSVKERLLEKMGEALKANITGSSCVTTGANILAQQGVTGLDKWGCLWVTIAWGFFFRVLFYLSLMMGSRNKRR